MARHIFVPLRGRRRHPEDPFWRFVSGKKTIEVRQVTSTVARQVLRAEPGASVLLRRGYSTRDEILGDLGRVWQAATWSTLPDEARLGADRHDADLPIFFDPSRPLLAFEITNMVYSAADGHASRIDGAPLTVDELRASPRAHWEA